MIDRDFTLDSDETLVGFYNDYDGSASWNRAVEDELIRRGFTTRDDANLRCLPTRDDVRNSRLASAARGLGDLPIGSYDDGRDDAREGQS